MIAPHSKNNAADSPWHQIRIWCLTLAEINMSHFAGTCLTLNHILLNKRDALRFHSELQWKALSGNPFQKSSNLAQDSFALLLQPTYQTITVTEPLIQSTTLAFSTSLNTDHFWSPIWLYRANKQHCPNFWLPMDHPISASYWFHTF